jgi:hypothetical protein
VREATGLKSRLGQTGNRNENYFYINPNKNHSR